jgi:hypothetical protein
MRPTINWIAVLVAAIVHFALGAAWFTVFMPRWVAGLQMTPEQVQAAHASPSPLPYAIAFFCNLVLAFVIAWFARGDRRNLLRGVLTGLFTGLAVAAGIATEAAFELKHGWFILIAAGYPLAGCILMGAILGVWTRAPRTPQVVGKAAA